MTTPAGYYEAEGDPTGTVRYWDGTQWTSEPMAPPPGFDPAHDSRMAGVWVRIGASVLDSVVSLVVAVPFMIGWLGDVLDQIDAGVPADEIDATVPASLYLVGFAVNIAYFLMVSFVGATPGKLMLGQRITIEDGTTTPPGIRRGALRSVPQLAAAIPVIGPLISIAVAVISIVWVSNDYERRSVYDRIAGTRVVHKQYTR